MRKFVSIDVEATGPHPNGYSLLSIGLVPVLYEDGAYSCREQTTLSLNLRRTTSDGRFYLPNPHQSLRSGADFHPDTQQWWSQYSEAWIISRQGMLHTKEEAAQLIIAWAQIYNLADATLVAWPTSFDIPFFNSCFSADVQKPFGYDGLCLNTLEYIAPLRGFDFPKMPEYPPDLTQHVALHDAIMQGRFAADFLNACSVVRGDS